MLTLLGVLAMQAATAVPLTVAPGQAALDRAHQQDFPKVGWVVADKAPVSSLPQLGGQLLAVLERGAEVQVAGLGAEVVRRTPRVGADDVFAVPVDVLHRRLAGFVLAHQVAVVETVLGRLRSGGLIFATVTGRSVVAGQKGTVLEVTIWLHREGSVPELLVEGPNLPPGLNSANGADGGVAVVLGGRVVVIDPEGKPIWHSPEGQRWKLVGPAKKGFVVVSPHGRKRTVAR